jgi:O-antigen/teichoic acid export membrane protein
MIPSFYFARELVELIFKDDFPLTVFVFQWIPIWVYVTPLTMLNIILLLAMGRRLPYMLGTVAAAAVNVGSNFLLIAALSGRGAVFSRYLAEGFLLVYSLALLPGDLRAGQVRDIGIYAGNLAVQVGLFRLHAAFGHRPLFLGLSVACFLAVVLWQKTLTRKTLSVMLRN